jgi:hypothetical protein
MTDPTDVTSRSFADLEQLLAELLRDVPDSRFVWCADSLGFETHAERCEALLLGGAIAPGFLPAGGWLNLNQTRVLALPAGMRGPLRKWVPFLEQLAMEKSSLLVVADEIDTPLLRTLVANHLRGTISCIVIGTGGPADINAFSKQSVDVDEIESAAENILKQLPRIGSVQVRRAASIIFSDEQQELEGTMSTVELIHVGGSDVEDLGRRRKFLECAIRDEDAWQGHGQWRTV